MIELLLNAESQLALGLLDQAERTYRTVLEADPRNAIAAVGLSRVALEHGDEAGAHALARAALEIDPANATARRMLDRLDEVARYRDAAVAGLAAAAAAPGPADAPPDPPAAPPADDPGAMIRASGILGAQPEGPSGARAAGARDDSTNREHEESSPGTVDSAPGNAESAPGTATASRPALPSAAEHGSSTDNQRTGGGAGNHAGATTPLTTAAPAEAAPARPGLLRRIFRRS